MQRRVSATHRGECKMEVQCRPAVEPVLGLSALAASPRAGLDLFHLVDQSYSQLVHELPAHRTVVTCHDLDTFRSVFEPDKEPRSMVFRAMSRRI